MYGLKPNWDKAIKSKKSYFKDDLFTMYNSNDNRNINGIYGFGFCDKENITNEEIASNVWAYCDMLPISTKKWIDFMSPIYKEGEYSTQHELLTGLIVGLLKKEYDINRLVKCDIHWDGLENNGFSNKIDTNDGLNREEAYFKLSKDNYEKITPIVKKIYKEIKLWNNKKDTL